MSHTHQLLMTAAFDDAACVDVDVCTYVCVRVDVSVVVSIEVSVDVFINVDVIVYVVIIDGVDIDDVDISVDVGVRVGVDWTNARLCRPPAAIETTLASPFT
jgi:hypothetical protein